MWFYINLRVCRSPAGGRRNGLTGEPHEEVACERETRQLIPHYPVRLAAIFIPVCPVRQASLRGAGSFAGVVAATGDVFSLEADREPHDGSASRLGVDVRDGSLEPGGTVTLAVERDAEAELELRFDPPEDEFDVLPDDSGDDEDESGDDDGVGDDNGEDTPEDEDESEDEEEEREDESGDS